MRKFIVCLFAMFVFGAATAETMCVKLDAGKDCDFEDDVLLLYHQSNWNMTCSGVPVTGIAYCSNQDGGTRGTKSDGITMSETLEENQYCWCKMTSPAASSWVYSETHGEARLCVKRCARICVNYAAYSFDFRSVLFSDLQ